MSSSKVSVIIVSYNVSNFLLLCLDSVYKALVNITSEIIVVDNNSEDNSVDMIKNTYPNVTLIENKKNVGFGKANNQGVAISSGEYILFLNPDTIVQEDFFAKSIAYLDEHPTAGSIGPKILDGLGNFAPDSKKSFPSLRIAIFRSLGISKIFKNSTYFNGYYAIDIDENQTSPVDILSGCCMMVRKSIIDQIGIAFDEDYFMYCEDFDLCCRIKELGYENIYYPATRIIHYKGESTRKATFNYIKVFYSSLILFIQKNYKGKNNKQFINFLKFGIFIRAILHGFAKLLNVFKLPILDAIILLLTFFYITRIWMSQIKDLVEPPFNESLITFISFAIIWVISLFFNGAYDKPLSIFKAARGSLIGSVIIFALYGLLPFELRFSRIVILASVLFSSILIILLRYILDALHIIKLIPYGKNYDYKISIVGDENDFAEIENIYHSKKNHSSLVGYIHPTQQDDEHYLGSVKDIKAISNTFKINEVIFSAKTNSFHDIFDYMQTVKKSGAVKIKIPNKDIFVGCEQNSFNPETYSINKVFTINRVSEIRNKRLVDIICSLMILFLSPILFSKSKIKKRMLTWSIQVLKGNKTWIGYSENMAKKIDAPKLSKTAIFPPYIIQKNYIPSLQNREMLALNYATKYYSAYDFILIYQNLKQY